MSKPTRALMIAVGNIGIWFQTRTAQQPACWIIENTAIPEMTQIAQGIPMRALILTDNQMLQLSDALRRLRPERSAGGDDERG